MSFADFGFDVFSSLVQRSNHHQRYPKSGGDCPPTLSEINAHREIIDRLINLGTVAENESTRAKIELAKYKRLKLTGEQIEQLQNVSLSQFIIYHFFFLFFCNLS